MKQRIGKPSYFLLVFLAVLSLLLFFLAEMSQTPRKANYYNQKIEAASLAQKAQNFIKQELDRRGYVIDVRNDPNLSGMIGPQYSLITTDRSSLRDKLISTNPNLSAVLVDLYHKAKLVSGDTIAILFSGSFPGANIAVLAACKVMGIIPVIVTSLGSSSYGATWDEFTWLDMESALTGAGLWGFKSIAASLGGSDDQGRGLSPKGRTLLEDAIRRNGIEYITSADDKDVINYLDSNIKKRIKILQKAKSDLKYKLVINVGGGQAAVGSAQNARLIPPGYNAALYTRELPARGAVNILASRRMPIIHILDLTGFADKYNLPLEASPEPEIGKGPVFVRQQYSIVSTTIYTMILLAALVGAIRFDLRYHIIKNRHLFVRKPR